MNLYRRTFGILKPYWIRLGIASLSAAISATLAGLLVWMAGPLLMTLFQIDSIPGIEEATQMVAPAEPGETTEVGTAIERFKQSLKATVNDLVVVPDRKQTLYRFCWAIMLIVIVKNVFLYLQGFFMAFVQQAVMRDLRDGLFAKYQRLPLSYFHQRRTGHIISRVTNDVVVLNDSIDLGFNHLITDTIQAILFVAFLVILSWKLTLLAMVVLPLVFVFIWFLGKKLRKYSARSQRRMADVSSVLEENVSNARIVRAFAAEKFEMRKFFKATAEFFRQLLHMRRVRYLSSPINDTLISTAGVVILVFAGTQIIAGRGELDAGDFMTFVIAMFSLIKPVKSLSTVHIRLQEGLAASQRIFQVLDAEETIVSKDESTRLDRFKRSVRYDAVGFRYEGSDEYVLKDISFEVKKGQIVAIVGPSGAGKSTLLDLLPRFYDPQSGRVSIDDRDIRDVDLTSLRGLMGIVTQETLLFNDTVFNNIAYGLENVTTDRVIEAARMANAHQFIEEFEEGYQTMVGSRGVRLSGGQRQRLAIARALLRDPDILIFDEATSALDTESELLVQEAIGRLMADRTTLVVAHRLSTITNADHILVMERGRIVESGSHDTLLQLGGLYRRLYDLQFKNGSPAPTSETASGDMP